MPVTVETLDAAFVEVGDHLSGRRPTDAERLVSAGICPSVCPGPGHTEPVFCDRDVDPATGEHLDGKKMHRGYVEPAAGLNLPGARGPHTDWLWG